MAWQGTYLQRRVERRGARRRPRGESRRGDGHRHHVGHQPAHHGLVVIAIDAAVLIVRRGELLAGWRRVLLVLLVWLVLPVL